VWPRRISKQEGMDPRSLHCLVRRLARHGYAVMLLAVVSCVAPQPPAPPPLDQHLAAQLGVFAPLLPLYQALEAVETGHRREPVVVLQIGDSHTANDGFSGRLRELFQARFGDAGRGLLPPGIPHAYYRPDRVSVTSSGWRVVSSYHATAPGPFGITGLRQHADGPAEMTLSVDDPADLARVEVELLAQPGGGTVDVVLENGSTVSVATAAAAPTPLWPKLPSGGASHTLTLRARGDGPVDVLAWGIGRDHPGVEYANLGTIGATVELIGRWDPAFVAAELGRLRPAAMLVAFGTNEGFHDDTDPASYAATYAANVEMLHGGAPGSAVLVIGPPDGNRLSRPGQSNGQQCASAPAGRHKRNVWAEPTQLAAVREDEHQVAARQGWYFWDWSAAMGGVCSIATWANADPPLAGPDHVHLRTDGYRQTAEALFQQIMAGYARYLALRRGS
jgi:lysophospholipase L1-like esterase